MVSRQCKQERQRQRQQALQRYEKQRRRNLLAEPGPQPFILILDHLKAGFNVPKIFRSAEAFGAHAIHLIGIGPFDPAPAKGAFKKVPARFHEDFHSCYESLKDEGYQFYTLEPEGCEALTEAQLPAKSAYILGHEELGISFDRHDYPAIQCLGIPQCGVTQSLNVSVAASIVMYEYARQHPLSRGG